MAEVDPVQGRRIYYQHIVNSDHIRSAEALYLVSGLKARGIFGVWWIIGLFLGDVFAIIIILEKCRKPEEIV